MSTSTLGSADALPLLSAWCGSVLRHHGIRVLQIKGFSLEHHQLRARRLSTDIDLLVHPADFVRASGIMQRSGWQTRPTTFAQNLYTEHSVSFLHPQWPIDIDLHHAFPGFLEPAGRVFEELWERRHRVLIAQVPCDIPDRLSSALILALHSLRGLTSAPRHRHELEDAKRMLELSPSEREALLDLAIRTGCDATAHTFLMDLGIVHRPSRRPGDPDLRDWLERVETPYRSSHMWGRLLTTTHGVERLRVVRHLLWPSRRDLEMTHPSLVDDTGGRGRYLAARVKRAWRGLPILRGMLRSWLQRISDGLHQSR